MRRDVPAVVALSLRLGARLLARDSAGEARDVYRRALESAPTDVAMLRALAALLSPQEDAPERAVVLERLLENEVGAEAGHIGIELAELWAALGDDERGAPDAGAGGGARRGRAGHLRSSGDLLPRPPRRRSTGSLDGRGGRATPGSGRKGHLVAGRRRAFPQPAGASA